MVEKYIYLIIGLIVGIVVAYLWVKQMYAAKNAILQANRDTAIKELTANTQKVSDLEGAIAQLKDTVATNERNLASKEVATLGLNKDLVKLQEQFDTVTENLRLKTDEVNTLNRKLATVEAKKEAMDEKLATQKKEMEALGKKFNTEFENIANKILDTKSEKFTKLNSDNLKNILEPLGKNIAEFKTKVEEVYNKESKERFSLGEKVKDLVGLSETLSKEAQNLTLALKGDPKKQGNWGEMILERILEESGLTKDREYYMENYLKDDNGNYMMNEEGKKMRPDAIIQYPDNRKVIIDAKVSINAYVRYVEAETSEEQQRHLKDHVAAIKNHIITLSNRGYENFEKSLDYVMMFIPNEPAFMEALKAEKELWNFAYKKRIVLISPTNLIITLKIIEDLWKREHQNQNAKAIADRGTKLLEKFVSFAENFKKVGKNIDIAQASYSDAFRQLSTGPGSLVSQAEKMRALGVDTKKKLDPIYLEANNVGEEEIDVKKQLERKVEKLDKGDTVK